MSPRRVTIVTAQLPGFDGPGGVGAATASLAIALARIGHDVDVLYIKERPPQPLDREWARRYDDAGVGIRRAPAYDVPIEPASFRRMRAVELALRADTPEVVIAHEYGAPAYVALRLRQLGLAFQDTLFVAYCHGTSPWLKEVTGNPRVVPEMLATARLEQMGVELADVVVSPSAYLLGWMQERGWRLPAARVIPLVTLATAIGEVPSRDTRVDAGGRVRRLAYFGRLQEVKGIRPFVSALNMLPRELLEGIEIEFLGGLSRNWDPNRVTAEMSERTRRALRRVSFETGLARDEALARLRRPGTLAVMPSLAENSPNVLYECLEARIPFLASDRGGMGELVATEDRPRVLFQPTPEGISAALRRALVEEGALRPARPSFDGAAVLSAWTDIVGTEARRAPRRHDGPMVDVVAPGGITGQTYDQIKVIDSLDEGTAEWVIFLDEEDVPMPELVETLVRAQAASGAEVVSCGLVVQGREHYFLGEPGGVGTLENSYGTVALFRRALFSDRATPRPDPWPLLAQLSAGGARIVSVPLALFTTDRAPRTLQSDPADALLVVEALERVLPDQARLLARLAASLASEQPQLPPRPTLRGRVRRRLGSLVGGKPGRQARSAA